MPKRPTYDIFLAHNSSDKAFAEELAERLEDESGLRPFLDKWHVPAGEPVMEVLETGLETSRACAVLIGGSGTGPWQSREFRIALELNIQRPDYRVIPVFIPGATDEAKKSLPPFLRALHWLDLRDDPDGDEFQALVRAIRGKPPGRPRRPEWVKAVPLVGLREPTGLAVDAGSIFVADHANGTVTRFRDRRSDIIVTGLDRPHHLACMAGTLLVCDTYNNRVLACDHDGAVVWERQSFGRVALKRPHGVASNEPGSFYVLSTDAHALLHVVDGRLARYVRNPRRAANAALGCFSTPCGLGLTAAWVVVADTFNHRVQVFDYDLVPIDAFGTFGYESGHFAYPVGIGMWHEWAVVADEHNHRLQLWRVKAARNRLRATPVVDDITEGVIDQPFAAVFSPRGELFVTDRMGGRVFVIDFARLLRQYAE